MISGISKKKTTPNFFVGLLFLFLIIFPKGGIKINTIPITWGYILLGIISLIVLIRKRYSVNKQNLYILLSLIPFQIYTIVSISINGIANLGFTISFFIGFFILPFIFLFVLCDYIQNLNLDFFFKLLKVSILFIASYGIFLFFFKIFFGKLIEIPLLTINYHDKGLIELTKSIDRLNLLKLISTYNNGNLYGVCVLMLLPLYYYLEKSVLKKSIVIFSLLLTLSRTIWAGLIICEFFYDFFIKKNKIFSLIKFTILSLIFLAIILFLMKTMNWHIDKILDPTLGNRIDTEDKNISLLCTIPFDYIKEILYLGIIRSFGIAGLIFFIFGFFSPLLIFSCKFLKKTDPVINKTIFLGLVTYSLISILDAAILYIPILSIYWFLSSFLMIRLEKENAGNLPTNKIIF